MEQVFNRIAKWNAARYEQEFNLALTVKLLREEQQEWVEAKTRVDQVHELCDIIYVAIGAMWKLKEELSPEASQMVFEYVDETAPLFNNPGVLCSATIDSIQFTPEDVDPQCFLSNLFTIVLFAQAQLLDYGLTFAQIIECLLVLCDSNDSKTVKKTASDVKANDKDKGTYYKSPIPGLQAIIGAIH